MNQQTIQSKQSQRPIVVTAGSTYLDIDAYACAVALAELWRLKGCPAIAYSAATANYSVCASLTEDHSLLRIWPSDIDRKEARYIIVDVSDPDYIKDAVPLDQVVRVYDHHVGFESYWNDRIGEAAHIEFIGAAATLIYREWKNEGLQGQMKSSTARLLVAAILDNTLNLTSSNTTPEDEVAFRELCQIGGIDETWRAAYFEEIQKSVELDLQNALMGDLKSLRDTAILPPRMAQLCVWDAQGILGYLPEIRRWFEGGEGWMINIISLKESCSYFVCYDAYHQKEIERVFDVRFKDGVAVSAVPYLRKQMIKKAYFDH